MVEIIPAIIPKSFSELEDKLSLVQGIAPIVQIDILDGKLTSEKSWPNIVPNDPDFLRIIHEEEGFPYWEDFDFEFDLMVADPMDEVQKWISAGAKRIVAHYESFKDKDKLQNFIESFNQNYRSDGSIISTELGIGINMETPDEVIDPIVSKINFVQFMGIDTIGRQGEPFDAGVLEKIKDLRSRFPNLIVSIDGGVNMESAPKLVAAGVNRLVMGSSIFGSDDIAGTIEELRDL